MKRIIAILLALVLVLSGCSAAPSYTPTGDGLTWDEDYTGPVYTKPQEEQNQALTLTYYPQLTMNPLTSTDYTNRTLFSLIYQSLFVTDRDYNVEPLLCKQYRMSSDMLTYTFYLQPATFSDGTMLTGQDVVASLLAAKAGKYYGGRFTFISSIALAEDGGVEIKLSTPMENLPLLLDIPIIRADQLEEQAPLGTGPYYMDAVAMKPCLRRRTNWWCSAEMIVTAPVISLTEAESVTQIRDQFQFEDLSLVCADPGSDRYADYRCDYELWDSENGIFMYLSCCSESEVFSVDSVRQALTYAIDRDTLVESYYRGFARAASLPASPICPWYNNTLASRYRYDANRFAQAVRDAGMEGKTVKFLVNSDDSLRLRVARDIAKMLTDAGLVVEMKELSSWRYEEALLYRMYDLYLGQTKLSPNMDLSQFFTRSGDLCWGGTNNAAAYTLCQQALENQGNYYTLYKTVMDEGLLCPVLFRSYAVYATRGLLTKLTPSRDNVFYYSLGRTMEQALIKE